ncbi:MAG: ABC transporter ATP-binding protein [Mycoplasma sp.]
MCNSIKKTRKEAKALYKLNLLANKKYLKDKTINKVLEKITPLKKGVCVEATNIWKIIPNKDKRFEIVKDISLSVKENEFVMILGESGSGKTTLISLLSALERPSEGNVNLFGNNTSTMNHIELTKLRFDYVGYIFQQYGLLKDVSIFENIIIALDSKVQKSLLAKYKRYICECKKIDFENKQYTDEYFPKTYWDNSMPWSYNNTCDFIVEANVEFEGIIIPKTRYEVMNGVSHKVKSEKSLALDRCLDGEYILDIIKELELTDLMNTKILSLSGGQQQRVSIARAIVKQPKILFADEPTGAVDTLTGKMILDLFLKINQKYKTTIVMVTHNKKLMPLASRIITISDGKVLDDKINKERKTIDEISFE